MKIIRLSKNDTPQILELDKTAFVDYDIPLRTESEIRKIFESGFALGIFKNEKLLSSVQVSKKTEREWYVEGVATLPEAQGYGLADALLKEIIRLAKEENENRIKKITATVRPGNERSFVLFSKNGFANAGLFRDYYGKGKDRFLFELGIA